MDNYQSITTTILNNVDQLTQNYTQMVYQRLADGLLTTVTLLVTLYVVFFGVGMITGRLPFNLSQIVKHVVYASVVLALVTRWDFFSIYLGNVFTNGPAKLMSLISGGTGDPNALLSDVFNRGILAANEINKNAGLSTLGFLIVGYTLFYGTLLVVGYALYLLIQAKIGLAILVGMGPFFSLFLLFESTREFFMSYLRMIYNFALIPVLVSAVLSIFLRLPSQAITHLQQTLAQNSGHGGVDCVMVFLCLGILFGLLHQVSGYAAALSGGGLHLNPGNVAAIGAYFGISMAERNAKRIKSAGRQTWNRVTPPIKQQIGSLFKRPDPVRAKPVTAAASTKTGSAI